MGIVHAVTILEKVAENGDELTLRRHYLGHLDYFDHLKPVQKLMASHDVLMLPPTMADDRKISAPAFTTAHAMLSAHQVIIDRCIDSWKT